MKVRLLDIAEIELDEAWQWYETQSSGLGERFLDEIRSARKMMVAFPEAWQTIDDGIRRYRLKAFPYGLIYVVNGIEILIVAVAHNHRAPDYWRDRVPRR